MVGSAVRVVASEVTKSTLVRSTAQGGWADLHGTGKINQIEAPIYISRPPGFFDLRDEP